MRVVLVQIIALYFCFNIAFADSCNGKFVNPVTDICWSCLFPITLGPIPVNVGGRQDYTADNTKKPICFCPKAGFPVPGVPAGFWEPVRLIDVVRKPYCMVGLGGIELFDSVESHGSVTKKIKTRSRGNRRSFYHVHMYFYPLIYWLELLVDFLCLEEGSIDIAFISELDPTWNDDELDFILNPEAAIFGNPIAQAACAADCGSASSYFARNELFWCAGCQGGIYPFSGTVAAHIGGVQASQLIAQKLIAKLHRVGLMWRTSGSDSNTLCNKSIAPIIKKTQYKLQMTYPIPTTTGAHACNPLGRTEVIQGSGKEFPYKGEDFGYLLWRKRNCCIL